MLYILILVVHVYTTRTRTVRRHSIDLWHCGRRFRYEPRVREPAGRFTSHGPVDSATLHGKLWVSEDDTRTVLADKGNWDRELEAAVFLIRSRCAVLVAHNNISLTI